MEGVARELADAVVGANEPAICAMDDAVVEVHTRLGENVSLLTSVRTHSLPFPPLSLRSSPPILCSILQLHADRDRLVQTGMPRVRAAAAEARRIFRVVDALQVREGMVGGGCERVGVG